jgi:acetyltransferase-like isoleucine patch superfamily enzyme
MINIIRKLFFLFSKFFLRLIEFVNPRLYMVLYKKLLVMHGVKINGTPRYIASSSFFDMRSSISLGNRIVVSKDVFFLTHDYSPTTVLLYKGVLVERDLSFISPIVVGDNVFIGLRSVLLPGTIIGSNVIVAAGSVVSGVFPDNVVIAGCPAKVISTLDKIHTKWSENGKFDSLVADKR